MAQMHEGVAAAKATKVLLHLPGTVCAMAEARAAAGRPEEGLSTLDKAVALVEETDERHQATEVHRLRADMLVMQGDEAEAEVSVHKALEVARRQSAKSRELRATMRLPRLWQAQGRIDEARQELAAILSCCTEGFDSPDLVEARALFEELS
jgi:predicted ATPase